MCDFVPILTVGGCWRRGMVEVPEWGRRIQAPPSSPRTLARQPRAMNHLNLPTASQTDSHNIIHHFINDVFLRMRVQKGKLESEMKEELKSLATKWFLRNIR